MEVKIIPLDWHPVTNNWPMGHIAITPLGISYCYWAVNEGIKTYVPGPNCHKVHNNLKDAKKLDFERRINECILTEIKKNGEGSM